MKNKTLTSSVPTEFVVRTSRECMPGSCWGQYGRVAVVEVEAGTYPSMISQRAKGVVRIVWERRRLNIGKTDRCAFQRAVDEAYGVAGDLIAQRQAGAVHVA